jgi:S1-C subfamily serine protease
MKLLRSLLPVVALLTVPSLGIGPRLAAEDVDAEALYNKVVKSSVFIVTPMKGGGFGMGSGSLIDLDKKLVLTNYHVVDEEKTVFVQFPIFVKGNMITDKKQYLGNIPAGKAIKGTVLYRDKTRDLALVELATVPAGTSALPLAKTSPNRNQTVWNIGSPGDVEQVFSVTRGEVRAVAVEEHLIGGGGEVLKLKCKVITATNPINAGDSGGPLVNKKGEQVGVTESSNTRASLVNIFVDVTEVRALLQEKKITIKEQSEETGDKPAVPKKGAAVTKKDLPATKKEPLKDPATPEKDPGGVAVTPPKKDPGEKPATGPSEEAVKAADQALKWAKRFNDEQNRDHYVRKLKEIVDKYPNTPAAKEAEKLLKDTN